MSDDDLKTALNMMPYGFYAITSRSGEDVNAMSANWLTQATFEPRLLVLALQKTSYTHGLIEASRAFAVNILRAEDEERIKPFTKSRSKNPDKMKDAHYAPAPETGCPMLEGAAAVIECRVQQIIDTGGDHDLVVGEVVGAQVFKPGEMDDSLTLMDIGWSYAG